MAINSIAGMPIDKILCRSFCAENGVADIVTALIFVRKPNAMTNSNEVRKCILIRGISLV